MVGVCVTAADGLHVHGCRHQVAVPERRRQGIAGRGCRQGRGKTGRDRIVAGNHQVRTKSLRVGKDRRTERRRRYDEGASLRVAAGMGRLREQARPAGGSHTGNRPSHGGRRNSARNDQLASEPVDAHRHGRPLDGRQASVSAGL